MRGQKKFTILETHNDGVRFVTAPLKSFSEEFASLRDQYLSTQADLAAEIIEVAGESVGGDWGFLGVVVSSKHLSMM